MLATNQALHQGTERATLIQLLEKETLSQTHPAVCEKLADLYLSVNRTEEAKASYERALLLKPSRDQQNRLLLNLAQLEQQAGNWEGALDRMETLLEKDTTFPQKKMMLTRMKLVAEQADLPEAVLAIEQQLTVTPRVLTRCMQSVSILEGSKPSICGSDNMWHIVWSRITHGQDTLKGVEMGGQNKVADKRMIWATHCCSPMKSVKAPTSASRLWINQ